MDHKWQISSGFSFLFFLVKYDSIIDTLGRLFWRKHEWIDQE